MLFTPQPYYDLDPDAGSGAGGTGQTPPPTAGQPQDAQALAAEWQRRAAGWQSKFQAEQVEHQKAVEQLTALTNERNTLQANHDQLKTAHDAFQAKVGELEPKLAQTNAMLERTTMVVRDFPALIPFLGSDLLPTGAGDELKAKLTTFQQTLESYKANSLQQFQGSTTPPPPNSGDAEQTQAEAVRKEAMQALKEGNYSVYEQKINQYYELTRNKQS